MLKQGAWAFMPPSHWPLGSQRGGNEAHLCLPLLSLSAPTSPVKWPPCWCSVISFLSKPFCTYILPGPPIFCPELSGAPYPFLQKSDFFVFFGSPSREKGQKQTNFFLSQLKEEEPVGAECAQWSCGHLQGPLYSMGAIWTVEWKRTQLVEGIM